MTTPGEGIEKSALLLLTLGSDEAAEVLKHLRPREVQRLGMAMASLPAQPRTRVESVLSELDAHFEKGAPIEANEEHIRSMLTKALGGDRAAHVIARIMKGSDTAGIENLKWMDAATAADIIGDEHPQIIATILVHLDYDQAGEILKQFNDRLRSDVLLRIATLDGVQPVALRELDEALTRMLSGTSPKRKVAMGGVRHAARILNFVGAAAETAALDDLRKQDPGLAERIFDEMFAFEDIMDIDDRGIRTLLGELQSDSLVIALKGAAPDLRERILRNMSQRAAETLREDLEAKGPVRLSEVEAEQKAILRAVRRLAGEGRIMIGGKGGDDAFI